MRLNFGNKLLILLHWLCSLMICVAFVLCLAVPGLQANLVSRAEGSLGGVGARIVGGVVLALYLALSVATLLILIRRKKRAERGFITVVGASPNRTVHAGIIAECGGLQEYVTVYIPAFQAAYLKENLYDADTYDADNLEWDTFIYATPTPRA